MSQHSQDTLPHHSRAAAFIFKCCVFVFCMKYIMTSVVATDGMSSALDIVWLLQNIIYSRAIYLSNGFKESKSKQIKQFQEGRRRKLKMQTVILAV